MSGYSCIVGGGALAVYGRELPDSSNRGNCPPAPSGVGVPLEGLRLGRWVERRAGGSVQGWQAAPAGVTVHPYHS